MLPDSTMVRFGLGSHINMVTISLTHPNLFYLASMVAWHINMVAGTCGKAGFY